MTFFNITPGDSQRRHGVMAAGGLAALVVMAGLGAARLTTPATAASQAPTLALRSPRLVVMKARHLLHLFDGDRLIRTYRADLGLSPSGQKVRAGDDKTPEGLFHVVSKNAASKYRRFLGISYPEEAAVNRGLSLGLISAGEANALRAALDRGKRPGWNSALGGGIGIHGGGRGYDWTAGCIAVADNAIDELFDILRVGDPVEILP